jgi:hypothetical protein
MTCDNATFNNKQTDKLDDLSNSFEKMNCIRCFNHTMQLSAKALLKPFVTATNISGDQDSDGDDSNMPPLEEDEEDNDEEEGDKEENDDDDDEGDPLDEGKGTVDGGYASGS